MILIAILAITIYTTNTIVFALALDPIRRRSP